MTRQPKFQTIITAPTKVLNIDGVTRSFTPNPSGGVFGGKVDPNVDGPGGYTYGYIRLKSPETGKETTVRGYVCHTAGTFQPLKGTKNAHLLQPKTPEPNRIGLTSTGFASQGVPFSQVSRA